MNPLERRMSGMGDMSMGDGVPSSSFLQKVYWAAVGAVIACATIVNLYHKFLCRQRWVLMHSINEVALLI